MAPPRRVVGQQQPRAAAGQTRTATVRRSIAGAFALALIVSGCGSGSKLAGAKGVEEKAAPQISLRDQNGKLVDLRQQRGRVVLLTFLYTHCRDICPLMASTLNTVVGGVKPADRDHVRAVAVSIDPRGDTFASARSYVHEKHLLPQFHYLVGTKQDLEPVWSAYGILVDPVNLDRIDHTGRILVIDRDGNLRAGFPPTTPAATILGDVERLL